MQFLFKGKPATVKYAEINHKYHLMYRIWVGEYSNIIFRDAETGRWIEEDLGFTSLAQKLGVQLLKKKLHSLFIPKKINWQPFHKTVQMFGYYAAPLGDSTLYEIYGDNRKFKYSLLHKGLYDWELLQQYNAHMSTMSDVAKIAHCLEVIEA